MVEQWDDTDSHVEEVIALTGDYRVAGAAFEGTAAMAASAPRFELSRQTA